MSKDKTPFVKEERIRPESAGGDPFDKLLFGRHMLSYKLVSQRFPSDIQVCDLGCGDGYGCSFLSNSMFVHGVDYDPSVIESATRLYGNPRCTFSHLDLSKEMPDGHYDLVTMFQVLEHFEDGKALLGSILKTFHSSGTLVLTTPNRKLRLRQNEKPWNTYHQKEYTVQDLRELLDSIDLVDSYKIEGVFGPAEIMELEQLRIRRSRPISKSPFNALKKLVPTQIKNLFRQRSSNSTSFSESDLFVKQTELDQALDFYVTIEVKPNLA